MKDGVLLADCLNDSFLLYAYESDNLQSHNEQVNDVLLSHPTHTQLTFTLLEEECSNLDSCFHGVTELNSVQQQDALISLALQLQSTLQDTTAASAALRHKMGIDSHFDCSSDAQELCRLQERSLQLRQGSLSLQSQLEQFFTPSICPPHKPRHCRSPTPHSLDFLPGCSLALAACNSIFGLPAEAAALNDYELLCSLSHCTMFGGVYLAQQKAASWAAPVAIKCSEKRRVSDETSHDKSNAIVESPSNEIDILRWVSMLPPTSSSAVHDFYPGQQHICRMLQTGEDSSRIYCVLEHFSGGDLQEYVQAKQRLSEVEARRIFWQLLQAIYYLHRIAKVAHLDLSLENILLDAAKLNVFVCDFGVAVRLPTSAEEAEERQAGFASANSRPGKLNYMCGEVFSGRSFFASCADIYSLGVILLRLLCGPKAFAVTRPNSSLWRMAVQEGRVDACMEVAEAELEWNSLSDAAKELIARMLCPEGRRAKVEDLIVSEWMREETELAWKKDNAVLLHLHQRQPKKFCPPTTVAKSS